MNFHHINTEKINLYTGVGIGFRDGFHNHSPISSFGFELTFGLRYTPIKSFGIYTEIGLSTSLIQFGCFLKF